MTDLILVEEVNLLSDDFEGNTPSVIITTELKRDDSGHTTKALMLNMKNISNVGAMVNLLLAVESLGEELTTSEQEELLEILEALDYIEDEND